MSTYDATEGQLRLEDALKRVEGNADEAWYKAALAAVQRVATHATSFTTDEVWLVLERTFKVSGPREPRAMEYLDGIYNSNRRKPQK